MVYRLRMVCGMDDVRYAERGAGGEIGDWEVPVYGVKFRAALSRHVRSVSGTGSCVDERAAGSNPAASLDAGAYRHSTSLGFLPGATELGLVPGHKTQDTRLDTDKPGHRQGRRPPTLNPQLLLVD